MEFLHFFPYLSFVPHVEEDAIELVHDPMPYVNARFRGSARRSSGPSALLFPNELSPAVISGSTLVQVQH